jgi:hypothetical protein
MPTVGPRTRADLIHDKYGVSTRLALDPVTNTVGATAVLIAPNNPNRLELLMINLSALTVWVKPKNDVSASSGLVLGPNGGYVEFDWDDDYDLVGYEWWAIASGAGASILTMEIVAR